MDKNIILAGVGGQGTLSVAFCICNAALQRGLNLKQSEVHGMAQRGGAVQSHVRLSSKRIHSDLIPVGRADVLMSVEPLEALRYVQYLNAGGILVTSNAPVVNIPDYPELDDVLRKIGGFGNHILVDSQRLAKSAGSGRAENMVVLGAAAPSLGFRVEEFDDLVRQLFARKSERVVEVNQRALRLGQAAAEFYCRRRDEGLDPVEALKRVGDADLPGLLESAAPAANSTTTS